MMDFKESEPFNTGSFSDVNVIQSMNLYLFVNNISLYHEKHVCQMRRITLHRGWTGFLTAFKVQLSVSCQFDSTMFYSGEEEKDCRGREEKKGAEEKAETVSDTK